MSAKRRWNPDRPWWRRVLAFPAGPCWHVVHDEDTCTATWQRSACITTNAGSAGRIGGAGAMLATPPGVASPLTPEAEDQQ